VAHPDEVVDTKARPLGGDSLLVYTGVLTCFSSFHGHNVQRAYDLSTDNTCAFIGYFPQSLRQIGIMILEILQCIALVNPDNIGISSPFESPVSSS
jgi:hypothetical protein